MSLVNPVLIVIVTWWVGTGVVLYLQQRTRQTSAVLVIALLATSAASLLILKLASNGFAAWQSYAGFMAAVVLWGCLELSYYTGLISGIHKQHCPENCHTARRFRLALGTSIWHEISVLAAALVVVALCWKAANPAGLYTFTVLWLMRWSAKLNLFLGVPNFNTDWFPKRLAYAHSYMKRSPVSLFFPLSVLLASFVSIGMMFNAVSAPASQALAIALPCVLLMLAILEHLFMALPVADSALWNRVFAREDGESDRAVKQLPITSDDNIHPVTVRIGCVETTATETLAH